MSLDLLLQQCTVQLTISGSSQGTGFFVAPGLILTCYHIIKHHQELTVSVRWEKQLMFAQATVKHQCPDLDLALLRFTPDLKLESHPCVCLDAAFHPGDVFSLFGYPNRDYPDGCPVTGDCEGLTDDRYPSIKFKLAKICPDIIGAPLLNQRTGKVCGMVKSTCNRDSDLEGTAIPASTILQFLPKLTGLQSKFHQSVPCWTQLLPKISSPLQPLTSTQQTSQGNDTQTFANMSGKIVIGNVDGDFVFQIGPEEFKQVVIDPAAKQGLEALAALTQISEVREYVIGFETKFKLTCQQIDIIANYKMLHDLLHNLDLNCYKYILQESKRLSEHSTPIRDLISRSSTLQKFFRKVNFLKIDDRTILENLTHQSRNLENILIEIERILAIKALSICENRWLLQLQKAQTELHTAIKQQDFDRLPQAVNLLRRVLTTAPSRINTRLVAAAESLRLLNLVSTMQLIEERLKLVNASLNQDKFQEFQQGVESLRTLNSQLDVLITTHDNWQMFDLDLWRIEDNLEQDLNELKTSWPDLQKQTNDLQKQTKVLLDSTMNQRIITFQKDTQDLDAALKSPNTFKIKQCFCIYRKQAKEIFYQVDKALKYFCIELHEVGKALTLVLRIIE